MERERSIARGWVPKGCRRKYVLRLTLMPAVPVFPGLVIHAADASVLMTKGVLEAGVSKNLSQHKLLHLLFFPFKCRWKFIVLE